MFKQLMKLWYIQFSKKSFTFLCTFKKSKLNVNSQKAVHCPAEAAKFQLNLNYY